ncbi:hypothetical protein P5775_10525 [Bacillus cereus]|uniref:hypothetical protein n=1 Tax=Bacillus cereus TaxID=1396 RepID=UPI002405627F|nr:hypothetical protein [Bacillus cereus]MDF9623209.1 hypothetical protein [Bacillus cereus]MEB9550038.1 hypothetical protein [Bacillus cereus]
MKFGYYIVPRFPVTSNTNIGAYANSPHFKNVMLDLAYVIFLFMDGYITRSTSLYLKEWVCGLVDLKFHFILEGDFQLLLLYISA